jgi:hypothetical protein
LGKYFYSEEVFFFVTQFYCVHRFFIKFWSELLKVEIEKTYITPSGKIYRGHGSEKGFITSSIYFLFIFVEFKELTFVADEMMTAFQKI